jgi:hypothetical protein
METRLKPKIVTIDEQLTWVAQYRTWLELSSRDGGVGDPSKEHRVKCQNVLYDLPYWLIHILDDFAFFLEL